MDICRGLGNFLIAATLGAGLVWACQADAAVVHPGHSGQPQAVQATDPCANLSEPVTGLMADGGCRPGETVATGAVAAAGDGAACVQGHCLWCGAVPASEGPAAIPPPVREEVMAEAHSHPSRWTAPETPPPIA